MGALTTIAWTDKTYNPWIGWKPSDGGGMWGLLCQTVGRAARHAGVGTTGTLSPALDQDRA
jgi:hypothetical protein